MKRRQGMEERKINLGCYCYIKEEEEMTKPVELGTEGSIKERKINETRIIASWY